MNSITEIQEAVIQDFSMLDGDMEMTIGYLMELGEKLPVMNEDEKTDSNIVKGCQSKVWLLASEDDGKVSFRADSNTAITKGLVSILVRVLSGQTPDDIMNADLFFKEKIMASLVPKLFSEIPHGEVFGGICESGPCQK